MNKSFGNQNKPNSNAKKSNLKKRLSISTMTYVIIFIKRLKKSRKDNKYRSLILNQWLTTEYGYYRQLELSKNQIRDPMLSEYQIITAQDANVLFPEIETMIKLSQMMISVLEETKKNINPNKIKIGKQLNSFANGYKVYGTYFGNHPKTQNILKQLSKNHEHKMKQIENNMKKQMKKLDAKKQLTTIKDCMEQPLYRLFKYVLFMKEYIKRLTNFHPDYSAVNEAMKTFHDINNANNQLMKKIQQQQKQVKLEKLFGGAIKNTRNFISEMQADTIYSTGKIYVFTDLVIVSRIQTVLGTQREEKQKSIELDEFSYVQEQNDMKYYKNILILIGKQECVHLLFVEEGSRFEVFKCLNKTLRQLRIKSEERRKLGTIQKNKKQTKNKLTFTLQGSQDADNVSVFEPEFRVQILGFEVRPLTVISNDTVYLTRFMAPLYLHDEQVLIHLGKQSNIKQKLKIRKINSLPFHGDKYDEQEQLEEAGIKKYPHKLVNQRIQLHFSQLQNIYNMMIPKCSDKLPNIDPITKQVNIYSKGKKKTKLFEMRKFFIEEFFNFVFRHEQLLQSPIWFIQRLRINPTFWNYITERNHEVKKGSSTNMKQYGSKHCKTCEKSLIKSIEQFEHYRHYFLGDGNHLVNKSEDRYCFNFFNLLRLHLLQFSYICFNTLQRILMYYHYSQGRLDYPFIPHISSNKHTKRILRIYLTSVQNQFVTINFTESTTVGEIIDQIGMSFNMKICYDYDLVTEFNSKKRILDRDEFITDAVNILNITCTEASSQKSTPQKKKEGFFGSIKKWGHDVFSKEDSQMNRIYFCKTIYLHKSLEVKSLSNLKKKKLQIQKIYWSIKHGQIKLDDRQFIELAAYYYCIKQIDHIGSFSAEKLNKNRILSIIPADKIQAFQYYADMRRQIGLIVQREKSRLLRSADYLFDRIIEQIWKNKDYYTYYIQVQPKTIPESVSKVMPNYLRLGVNYKNIVITKAQDTTSLLVNLPLEDIQYFSSVFSIFLTHESMGEFRFDTKMVHHFGQVINKYQLISARFPQHKA